MRQVILFLLVGGCLSTPIQQGALRIVKYTAGRDGINTQNDNRPEVGPQPVVWSPDESIIVEPSPLTYGSLRGESLLTERDQQRHITLEDEVESREEDPEVTKVESQLKVDSKEGRERTGEDQRPVHTETAAQLGSSQLNLKDGIQQLTVQDIDQVFPRVVFGQRRLDIQTQPLIQSQVLSQNYAIKGKSLQPISSITSQVIPTQNIGIQSLQYGLPMNIEEQRVTSQGVKRPVVQYELRPIQQQQQVSREWVSRPQFQVRSAVKGVDQRIHYVIQPINPSNIKVVTPLVTRQRVEIPKPLSISLSEIQQRDQLNIERPGQVVVQPVQIEGESVREVTKSSDLVSKQGVKTLGEHLSHKVVVDSTARHVPVVSGQSVVGYHLVGRQPQTQTLLPNQVIYSQSNGQYIPYIVQQMPVSNLQQYYQLIQSIPIQTYGQQSVDQINSYLGQTIGIGERGEPTHYSVSNLAQVEQPVQTLNGVKQEQTVDQIRSLQISQGLQGVQRIQTQDQTNQLKGQDLTVNSLSSQQRSGIQVLTGVKGGAA